VNTWNANLRRLENTFAPWMLLWHGLWKRERDWVFLKIYRSRNVMKWLKILW